MKAAVVIAVLMASAIPAHAQVMVLGIGRMSCASWLATPSSENEGTIWLFGYWTGVNAAIGDKVGWTTDALGVVGAIKKRCEDDPADFLANVAGKVFYEFRRDGR
ncbi:MAG TPA: hypothetical protein VG757_13275 [Devosia sp.]|nr:hypothetical protein [Devosia sp.]